MLFKDRLIILSLASNTSWVWIRRGFVSQGSSTKTMGFSNQLYYMDPKFVNQGSSATNSASSTCTRITSCFGLAFATVLPDFPRPQPPVTPQPKPKGLSILVLETDLLVVWFLKNMCCSYFKVQVVLCYSKMPPPNPPPKA